MRILVDNGANKLLNLGDIAMLQVLIERLSNLWPDAFIEVFTSSPEGLLKLFPNVHPLLRCGSQTWSSPLVHSVYKLMPNHQLAQQWSDMEWVFRRRSPSLVRSLINFKLKREPEKARNFEAYMKAVYSADLVVTSGGGYITDPFKNGAIVALETLGLASRLDKVTAMFGTGLGPIQDRELLARSKTVLPSINLIALREKRAGLPLLNSIGVSQNCVMTTGDDAIELAYKARNIELCDGIGVNLRVAEYSGVSLSLLETVRSALHNVAKKLNTPLIPAPIDHSSDEGYAESDSAAIQKLLKGYDDTSDGGKSLDTPLKVIEQIGQCRVVVTGSYHAGVFALAQGIPAIGLAKSKYYANKFLGLADQFGVGCEVILLDDPELENKLVDSLERAWQSAEQLRPQLLEVAKRQVELGHTAYKRVYELVTPQ
ncbi:MAG: polysaccharide pyruvyl transferase family protein [Spirirestis rafaelensis WJT71-NPBG6]|jgi:colanic acid/amylovoran biosynthesis protein|nr:polysaccharide pyruvyl transferase family protein [Spirirestis rafaelensis WJT71-NPBG6]